MSSTALHDSQNRQNSVDNSVMSRPGLARAIPGAHQERQVACGGLNQGASCERFACSSYVQPVQSAGIKPDGRSSFRSAFAPLPLQTLAALALNPPPVATRAAAFSAAFAEPVPRPPVGFGNVGSHFQLFQTKHRFVAPMISTCPPPLPGRRPGALRYSPSGVGSAINPARSDGCPRSRFLGWSPCRPRLRRAW